MEIRGIKRAKLLAAGVAVAGSALAGSTLVIGGGGLPIGGAGGIGQLMNLLGGGSSLTGGGSPLASGITDNLNYPVNLDCLADHQEMHPMIPAGTEKQTLVPARDNSASCGQAVTQPRCASGPGVHPMYCVQ